MSDRKSSNGWKYGLGILAGAALGYWLNSEQGRRARREASSQINNYSNQATEYTKGKVAQAQSGLNSAIERGQELLHELKMYAKKAVNRTASNAEETLEEVEDSLDKGLAKAKDKINRKTEKLQTTTN